MGLIRQMSGGRFNSSRPKSDTEWKIYRARSVPGPCDTFLQDGALDMPLPQGGRFDNTARVLMGEKAERR